jgi:hypothetical protein
MSEVHSTAGQVSESLKTASEQARQWASDAANKGRSAFAEHCRSTAEGMTDAANAMHRAARDLEDHQNRVAARLMDGAGDYLANAAARLREKDLSQIMTDATNAARRNPWAFFAGSVAAGAILARFLKSSTPTSPVEARREFYPPATVSESSGGQHSTGGSYGHP